MTHHVVATMTKTFIVTGANTGIGKITARELAKRGAHVILACRSKRQDPAGDRRDQARDRQRQGRVRAARSRAISRRSGRCAEALLARNMPIHGLINNAGLAGQRGTTKDGFELTFGTNHLGHYLFTRCSSIGSSRRARRASSTSSSKSHYAAKSIDWDALQQPTKTVTGAPRVRGLEARERAVHEGARAPPRGHAASRRTRCTPASSRPTSGAASRRRSAG